MYKNKITTIGLASRFLHKSASPKSLLRCSSKSHLLQTHANVQFGIKSIHSKANKIEKENELEPSTPPKIIQSFYDRYVFPEPPAVISEDEHNRVITRVNEVIKDPGRLFAVVSFNGHQYKVTTNDIISTVGYIPADCGTRIRLEKVGMVGGADFTIIGRPILRRNIVKVEATIIEKTPSVDVLIKRFMRRRNYERTHRFTSLHTILRINSIEVLKDLE